MQIKIIIVVVILALLFGCDKVKSKKQALGKYIEIELPIEYQYEIQSGTDNFTFKIVSNGKDILFGQLGEYINELKEPNYPVLSIDVRDSVLSRLGPNSNNKIVFFSKNPITDTEERVYSKQFYLYDTVNTLPVKFIMPKVIGNGKLGILVHGLPKSNSFVLYGENLDSINYYKAIKIFKSIRAIGK